LISSGTQLPGAVELLKYLMDKGIPFRIITNTISKTPEDLSRVFSGFGLDISPKVFITPFESLNTYLNERNTRSFYFVGSDSMKSRLSRQPDFDGVPEYVILCDFESIDCSYGTLNRIFNYLINGAKLITASNSEYYLSKGGLKLDTGAFARMFEITANQKAVVLGKPSSIVYRVAAAQIGLSPEEVITVGDDVLTDIRGGKEFGAYSVLVKTGKYKNGDEELYKPDEVIGNLMELVKLF
jgi:HAD superfamily hydrolase (TIGR01458 family)